MQVSLQGSKQQCEQLLPNSDYSEYNPKNDSMVLSSSTSMLLSDIRLSDMLNALRSSKSSQVNSLSGKASCIVRHFRRFSVLEGSVLTIPFSYQTSEDRWFNIPLAFRFRFRHDDSGASGSLGARNISMLFTISLC